MLLIFFKCSIEWYKADVSAKIIEQDVFDINLF